jgi:iron-sulfur cluster assembly protein
MLTLTENASTIVKDITSQAGAPGTAGLRISSEDTAEPSFAVSAAPEPEPGDQVVEQSGATVYLDESAAVQLDDKVLDAGVDDSGNVSFALTMQAPGA